MKVGKYILVFSVFAVLIVGAYSFSNQPPTGMTGAPGETLCTDCHGGAVNDGIGIMELSSSGGLFYESNQTYQMTLTMERPEASIFGFSLCVLDTQNIQAGSMLITDSVATHLENFTRQYVSHKNAEDSVNIGNGSVVRQFEWSAPDTSTGPITFYYVSRMVQQQPIFEDGFYRDSLIIYPVGTEGVETAINEKISLQTHLYPNPVEMGNPIFFQGNQINAYQVYNAAGELVISGSIDQNSGCINTQKMRSGVYFFLGMPCGEVLRFVVY